MCGKDTFEMLVSSSSMNVAIVTVSAIAHGLCAGGATGLCVGGDSPPDTLRGGVTAAIPKAPPTFQDAADAQDPAPVRAGSSLATAVLLLRSCRSHSQTATG